MHRLRDLNRRQAVVAAVMVVLVLVPFVASVVRAAHVGWLPSGDDALIGLRTHDVFTAERPLVGQPSTSHLYGPDEGTFHPGPIEFYWLAGPQRLLGPSVGMIAGIAVVNLASVLVAAWVVLRRAGPAVAAWAMVVMALLLWSEGTAVLSDPISSNAGAIPLIALAALAWAVVDGDFRLLPVFALWGSWVAQQHLAIVIPAGGLVAFGVIGTCAHAVSRWRTRMGIGEEPSPDNDPDGDGIIVPPGRMGPWIWGALAVAALCWLPVAWQQFTGDPGNITAVITYAQESEADPVGTMAGVRQAVRALGLPPLLMRSDLTGKEFFTGPLSPLETASAIVSYAALLAIAIVGWRHRRTLSLLAVTALVLTVVGAYNGSSIPDSIEAFRINFYRWPFVVAWLTWIAFGWAGALVAGAWAAKREREVPSGLPRAATVAAVVVMLIPAVGTVFTAGYNDERRDQAGFGAMREMADAAMREADKADARKVTLLLRGKSAVLASGSAVTLQLTEDGRHVVIPFPEPEREGRFWDETRMLEPGDDPGDLILQLVSGRGSVPDGPGRTVAHVDMNEELRKVLAPLVADATGADVVPSDKADELLKAEFDTPEARDHVRKLLGTIATDPSRVLTDERLVQLMSDGYFQSPAFAPEDLRALRDALPSATVNDDDVFELRVLTKDELAEVEPEWAEGVTDD